MTAAPPVAHHPAGPRRLLPLLAWLLASLVLALSLGAAGLWWWSGREGSLATALAWGERVGLQAQGTSGSLRQGGQIQRLSWQQPEGGLRLQASELQLRWRLQDLLRSAWQGQPEIHLQRLQAELVRLEPRPSTEPAAPPSSLQLPVTVRVDEFELQRLQWAGKIELQAQDVAGSYRFEAGQHQLALRQARHAQGLYQGQVRLQAGGDNTLDAKLRGQLQGSVPGSARTLPLVIEASLQGPLQQLELQASLDSTAGPAAARSQAQLQARLAPWQDPPLPQAQARFQQLDLALLWPQAPHTRLSGQARVQPEGSNWRFETQLDNAAAAPWNQGRLPVQQLSARGQWQDGSVLIQDLQARLGSGRVQARGQWTARGTPQAGWQVDADLQGVDSASIDSRWPSQILQGRLRAEQALGPQALRFEASLSGQPGAREGAGAWRQLQAQARGQWQAGLLTLDSLALRSSEAELQASGRFRPQNHSGQVQGLLIAPGLRLQLRSAWPLSTGAGELDLQAAQAQPALRWLRSLPALPQVLSQPLAELRAQGRAGLRLSWGQGLADAQVQASLDLQSLDGLAGLAWRELQASAQGPLNRVQLQAQGRLAQEPRSFTVRLSGDAGLPPGALAQALAAGADRLNWRLALAQLELQMQDPRLGVWKLNNTRPLLLRGEGRGLQVEPGELALIPPRAGTAPALLAWQRLGRQGGEWHSTGTLRGLPLNWAEMLAGPLLSRAGMVGDLLLDGRWDLQLGQALRVQAELQRRSGDLSLHAETGQGLATRVAAGVREARLSLNSEGQALALGWRWDSERGGQSEGQLRTSLARKDQGWEWPANAPVSGRLQARLPRLGVWSALAPPGWRLRGSLQTTLEVSGTRSQPQLTGPLAADDLALRSVVDGIELGRGRLRATLAGEQLQLEEFSLQGPGSDGGSLLVKGEARWSQGEPQLNLLASLNRLRASVRADRLLTVSGNLQGKLQGLPSRRPVEVSGQLRVDQARIRLPDEERPQLDADVIVRRPGQPLAASTPPAARPNAPGLLNLAVRLDLGEDFGIEGKGLNAKLHGALAVTADSFSAAPRLVGSITTASGEYRAYGQRLEIERGLLRFAGPADNPTLDILALRPNLTQKVGVQVTGTALLPRVRLYAEPELPEAEKLAWLVLGRSGAAGGAEAAVLQQAAIALLGNRSAINRTGLAASLGLDELSLRSASQTEAGATGGAITFGKRLSNQFYAAYESSLSGAVGTLYLFYELSQRFTVRAQTGAQTAVDLIFTVPYD